jgi:hypothetical protein
MMLMSAAKQLQALSHAMLSKVRHCTEHLLHAAQCMDTHHLQGW